MSEPVNLHIDDNLLRRVESWRRQNPLVHSVEDALTILVRRGLEAEGDAPLEAFEKLNLIMMAKICQKLGVDEQIDPEFLQNAVQRGHFWAIEWQYPNLTNPHSNSSAQADFVSRLLSVWCVLADSFATLGDDDRARVLAESGLAEGLRFPGFDHGNETNYSSIARFMVEQLKLFPQLRNSAAVDARRPMLTHFRSLISIYDEVRETRAEGPLEADQLLTVLEPLALTE